MNSIQLYEFKDGFGLYENDSNRRLNKEVFLNLLIFLKNRFISRYVSDLYNDQGGYIFYSTRQSIQGAIEQFLNAHY